jgi:hypothetical protein
MNKLLNYIKENKKTFVVLIITISLFTILSYLTLNNKSNNIDNSIHLWILNIRNNTLTNIFKMYTNIDGFTNVAQVETGRFVLYVDELLGAAVIRGDYDHGAGEWAHRYTITELTKDSMTWTALDDPDFVQIFSRVDEIPVKK